MITDKLFAFIYNDIEQYPTLGDVAKTLEIALQTAKNRAAIIRNGYRADPTKYPVLISRAVEAAAPMSEDTERFMDWDADTCIKELQRIAELDPDRVVSRNYFRVNSQISESVWSRHFGTFEEFKRQAGIKLTRQQHNLERQIAKHVSVDHYRALSQERLAYADKYERPSDGRFKTLLVASDIHDKEVDPFWLATFLDTATRLQPDVITLNGDVWDAPEFGKYTVDPRDWDVVGRIKFIHERLLEPLRESCPDAQIDWISGNHEDRLCRHLADATPALRAMLSDLHGFTLAKLLGLDRFEINYVAKSDLAAYRQSDVRGEIAKNYKVYWRSYVTNHFAEGMRLGMPGTNGHSHKFKVTPCYSEIFGSYSWIQTGCGHVLDASYTNGEMWDMGFLIAHVDTHKNLVNQEYIPVTDFSVVGGKYYFRDQLGQSVVI